MKKTTKRKQYWIIILLAFFALSAAYLYQVFFKFNECVDFDKSMNSGLKITFGAHSTPEAEQKWFKDLKDLYKKNCYDSFAESSEYKIPPIIHHVWLGSDIPQAYKYLRQTWVENHPGWIFKLWTDADVDWFNLENRNLFDAARNYGEKSDIFRYEILKRYGGSYFDTDFMCIKSIAPLHRSNDFYTGIMNAGEVLIAIGAIGSVPEHPLLKSVMSSISQAGSKYDINNIMERTGPIHFTKIFVEEAPKLSGSIVAYPVTYFYPVPNTIRGQDCYNKSKEFIKPETFGVHLWECSWMRPQAFLQQYQVDTYKNFKDEYFGRYDVDKFVDKYFSGKQFGIFVDIGAEDGILFNNTYFLERSRNWKGICIEPQAQFFSNLSNNRISFCANSAIISQGDNNKRKEPFKYINDLYDVLQLCKFDKVDYLSISSNYALDILKAIDFNLCKIILISINSEQEAAENILIKNGYKLIKDLSGIKVFAKK